MEKAHITDSVNKFQRNLLFGLDLGLCLRFSFLLHRLHGFATAHQVTGGTITRIVNNHDKSTLFALILLTLLLCQTITSTPKTAINSVEASGIYNLFKNKKLPRASVE